MTDRPAKPADMPWLTPYLTVRNAENSLDFYQRAFGFEPTAEVLRNSAGRIMHAALRYRDAFIMLGPEDAAGCKTRSPATSGVDCPIGPYLYCDDVDALYRQALGAGARAEMGPQEMFWGDRVCSLRDPDGYVWSFATNVADFDPAKAPPI